MFGAAVPGYEPANFNSEDPPPTFDQAELGFLPRRCWFTRNANVRSVGCNSLEFGEDFAAVFLRKGSSIVTTTANVRGSCRGLPFQIGTALGIPGGCAWFNGMNFSSGLSPSDPTIEGPFWSVADFHAASHWETVNGKL